MQKTVMSNLIIRTNLNTDLNHEYPSHNIVFGSNQHTSTGLFDAELKIDMKEEILSGYEVFNITNSVKFEVLPGPGDDLDDDDDDDDDEIDLEEELEIETDEVDVESIEIDDEELDDLIDDDEDLDDDDDIL